MSEHRSDTDAGWLPIDTAPKDGTRIELANDRFFTAGAWRVSTEPDWNYDIDAFMRGERENGLVPITKNPKAGQVRREMWIKDNPCAFFDEDEQSADYDGNFDSWEPTHWRPLFPPTKPETQNRPGTDESEPGS